MNHLRCRGVVTARVGSFPGEQSRGLPTGNTGVTDPCYRPNTEAAEGGWNLTDGDGV
jgi:hypothetical protein